MLSSCRWFVLCLAGAFSWALDATAKQTVRLADNPALSPDGKLLALSYRGDIWVVSSAGGEARRITSHPGMDRDPHFSPKGAEIAFISDRAGAFQVFLAPCEGGPARQITFHSEGYAIEDWRPDGRSLLVSAVRDHHWRHAQRLFEVELDHRAAERLVFDAYGAEASLSPDGQRILFVREGERWWRKGYRGSRSAQIWLYEVENGGFTKLLGEPTDCRWPMWKANGREFYFVGGELGAFNLYQYDLRIQAAKQRTKRLTHYKDDSVVLPTLSRDGSTIVFRRLFDLYRFRPGVDKAPVPIHIVDGEDREAETTHRRMLERASEAAFSDDGLEIAFIAGGDLWVMDTELREPRQVTSTPDEESKPRFSADGETIWFISDRDGQCDIWMAKRAREDAYWWRNDQFTLTPLTRDDEVESRLECSPDGREWFFVKGRGDLWAMKPDGRNPRLLLSGCGPPDYDVSPDGKWLAYARHDQDFNRDVWLAPLDGASPPFNLSRHPDDDGAPVWSPDGRLIAFTGRRADDEVDIYYVWLRAADEDETSRSRRLKKAMEKIEKARRKSEPAAQPGQAAPPGAAEQAGGKAVDKGGPVARVREDGAGRDRARNPWPQVAIDFEKIHERLHRISIPNSVESELFWSPDSKKLAFKATVDGKEGVYTVEFPDPSTPRLLSATTGGEPRWLKKANAIVCLADGSPAALSPSGEKTTYSFRAYQETRPAEQRRAAFDLCWRTMRDWWYDERLGNRNWDAVRRKYRDAAFSAPDWETLAVIVELMLGELNGSHLGFSLNRPKPRTDDDWSQVTAHLGVRFDADYHGPGLRVRDMLPGGPADKAGCRIPPGEIVLSVDGVAVNPSMDLCQALNGRLDRDIVLRVRAAAPREEARRGATAPTGEGARGGEAAGRTGAERGLTLRPISYEAARTLLYGKWVDDNRAAVERLSGGKLSYLHIQAMNQASFLDFERELYAAGYGKDGLVIDVRENGGGSTTDRLLTALTQPVHASTVPRGGGPGYPQDRKVYATWNKPIVVLCNQNSFSNAEIFSHAIKTLRRGKLVGTPTAGGVLTTESVSIMDVGSLRRPYRGWYVLGTGEDMELNGAVPDLVVWPQPGDLARGKDVQLERAVQTLLQDVKDWKSKRAPRLRKASER